MNGLVKDDVTEKIIKMYLHKNIFTLTWFVVITPNNLLKWFISGIVSGKKLFKSRLCTLGMKLLWFNHYSAFGFHNS